MFSSILLLVGLLSISQCETESSFTEYEEIPIDNSEFQIALYDVSSELFMCGGALFNPYYALTAAKCVYSYRQNFYKLKVFLARMSLDDESYSYDIRGIFLHTDLEKYILNNQRNDIALIKLTSPVAEGLNIQYGILPDDDENIEHGRSVTVLTFGRTANVNCTQVLQKELSLVSQEFCRVQYQRLQYYQYVITEDYVCAYNVFGSCVGSLGFPLVDTRKQIIGIVTFPFICGPLLNSGLPTVFARVSPYVSWIQQTVIHRSL